jgi:glycosyltransferase involved in cell wall biosynthesis
VLTPVHNKILGLEKTFDSIKRAIEFERNFQIAWVVSDNFSTDGSSQWLSSNQKSYKYQIVKPQNFLPALENFRFLAQKSESLYSIFFAADDFCSEEFFAVLLRQAIQSDLDGVVARTIRGKDPEITSSIERQRRLGILDVLRLTGDSVEGVYSLYKTHLLKNSLENLPAAQDNYGMDRVLWAQLFIGNKVDLQKDLSQFRFKTTFDDPTKHNKATLFNPKPLKKAKQTLKLCKSMLDTIFNNQKIGVYKKISTAILITPIHLLEIVDSGLPTKLRIFLRKFLRSFFSAYASLRRTDV